MEPIKLVVSRDFSPTPGPRYVAEGPFSGELFREEKLAPAMKQAINEQRKLIVILDGASGFGTSFLEESFGGLIREDGLAYEDIINALEIISTEEDFLKEDIYAYLKDALAEPVTTT